MGLAYHRVTSQHEMYLLRALGMCCSFYHVLTTFHYWMQVRSKKAGEVGFLADQRRMNVAVTRARRHCCLICDSETVSKDKFLERLVQYFEITGAYLSAAELLTD